MSAGVLKNTKSTDEPLSRPKAAVHHHTRPPRPWACRKRNRIADMPRRNIRVGFGFPQPLSHRLEVQDILSTRGDTLNCRWGNFRLLWIETQGTTLKLKQLHTTAKDSLGPFPRSEYGAPPESEVDRRNKC